MSFGENILGTATGPAFFKVGNIADLGLEAPEIRRGDALRTWSRHISGFQKEAIVLSTRTGLAWRVVSDEGAYLDGYDAAPAPLPFLTTGMVAATMNEILALAKQAGIEVRKLRLVQDNYYTMDGSVTARTMTGGALPIELVVEIDCDMDDGPLNELLMNAIFASPLNGLMRGVTDSLFRLSKNGTEIPLGKAKPTASTLLEDTDADFSTAVAAPGALGLLERLGDTPKKDVAVQSGTSKASVGLTDHQSRTLNIRAICELREDGVKDITTLLYSPQGTSFRFLSDEAPENGGQGRAPDATSYISAGIGLCFMTQIGRFASTAKRDLTDYRIIQDTHFSLGGATGGTGKPGEADPIETHVYLELNEDDEAAQEILDMGEQTCFLHAFCRTDLKTKLKVVRS